MFDVVIPAYNAEKSIKRAVASAVSAGASIVYVVDDGSSDATAYAAESAGATVIRQINSGASKARQRGAEAAESRLLIFLDADDALVPSGVAKSLQLISRNPSAVAVGGGVSGLKPDGHIRQLKRAYSGTFGTKELVANGFGPWPPGAAIVRRQAYLESLDLPIRKLGTRYAEDYEMFIRISSKGDLVCHTEPALIYSMHEGKSSQNSIAPLLDKEAIRAYYGNHFGIKYKPMRTEAIISSSMFRAARKNFATRSYFTAATLCLKGLLIDPSRVLRIMASKSRRAFRKNL